MMKKLIKCMAVFTLCMVASFGLFHVISNAATSKSNSHMYLSGVIDGTKAIASAKNLKSDSRYMGVYMYSGTSVTGKTIAVREGVVASKSYLRATYSPASNYNHILATSAIYNSSASQSGTISGAGLQIQIK